MLTTTGTLINIKTVIGAGDRGAPLCQIINSFDLLTFWNLTFEPILNSHRSYR
jgi:hypothetical protein